VFEPGFTPGRFFGVKNRTFNNAVMGEVTPCDPFCTPEISAVAETTKAAYGRIDYGTDFNNGWKLIGNFGLRYVETEVKAAGIIGLPDGALPSDDFHVYAVEWGEGLIRFLVDDHVHLTVTADQWDSASPRARGNAAAPFDQPFYVMANLAVGGRLAEENNAKGVAAKSFPAQFAIDWIRVYQCAEDPDRGRACMR
jgi:hypothetical protein